MRGKPGKTKSFVRCDLHRMLFDDVGIISLICGSDTTMIRLAEVCLCIFSLSGRYSREFKVFVTGIALACFLLAETAFTM